MKRQMILLFFIMTSFMASGQQTEQPEIRIDTKAGYLLKSKRQKTWAIVLTSAGATGLAFTLATDMAQAVGNGVVYVFSLGSVEPEYKSYTGYYVLSGALVAGGVALFVASAKNKNRARNAQAYIKMEHADLLPPKVAARPMYPALTVAVRL